MICMTLLVRDEEDIVRDNIEYHLSRGVDLIIATDNRSVDATASILREYERAGVLRYIYEPGDDYSQDLWVTRMARLACVDHGADWVIHCDADEFWWPTYGGGLPNVLRDVSPGVDGLLVDRHNFVPLASHHPEIPPHRQMVTRYVRSLNSNGQPLPPKVVHRSSSDAAVHQGNHSVSYEGRVANLTATSAIEILHFPLRSRRQFERKISAGGAAYRRNTRFGPAIGSTWRKLHELQQRGSLQEWMDSEFYDDARVAGGLASGELTEDFRLADYLQGLKRIAGTSA